MMAVRRSVLVTVSFLSIARLLAGAGKGPAPVPRSPQRSSLWCEHTVLVYTYPCGRHADFWTADRFKWLAAYRTAEGECQGSLFDGFLILGFSCKGGRSLLAASHRDPATKSDWSDAIDVYLDAAAGLSSACQEVSKELDKPDHKAKIIVAVPYPDPRATGFGSTNGGGLRLWAKGDRVRAVQWYIDETLRRWDVLAEQRQLEAARLVGFYWGEEGISRADTALVRSVASYVHDKGYLMHWIPAFGAARRDWKELGLDCVTQQINYQNPQRPGRPLSIFDDKTRIVEQYGLHGVEMTPMNREVNLNPRVWSWHQVFLANLEAALRLDWQQHHATTYYHGNALAAIAADPQTHVYYEKLRKWIVGDLTLQDVEQLCELVMGELKTRGVLNGETQREIGKARTVLDKLRLMERPAELRKAMLATEEAVREKERPQNPIGETWLSVTADEPHSSDVRRHTPGVCFMPGQEWEWAAVHEGKAARFGGLSPGQGGPNFFVNDPPDRDIEVRLVYWARSAGALRAYDGKQYHTVADLDTTDHWTTVTARVSKEIVGAPWADYGRRRHRHPGRNVLFEVRCADVYVHRIEARAAPE